MRTAHSKALKALVVDDDHLFGNMLKHSLPKDSYDVSVIGNYSDASAFVEKHIAVKGRDLDTGVTAPPDVIILDYFLDEGKTGLELCRTIRSTSNIPVIMLTGNDSVESIVACLDSGADQYIVKPCQMTELVARIKACTRNRPPAIDLNRKIEAAGITLMTDERILVHDRKRVELTEKECVLAEVLLLNLNQPVAKEAMRKHVYGNVTNVHSRNLDVLVGRLRKKLKAVGKFRIYSLRNVGYKLVPVKTTS